MRASPGPERSPRSLITLAALATFVAAFAACDRGDIAEPRFEQLRVAPKRDFLSGTRLKAHYHTIDGVVDVFTSFHDIELDLDCAYEDEAGPHVGPGAISTCLPANLARHRTGRGPFVDSACASAAALAPSGEPAMFALVEPRNACKVAPSVHLAKAPEMRRTWALDDAGNCNAGDSIMVQRFGGVLPPDTFVRAVEETDDTPGRLGARSLVGDDGSRRVIGGFDRRRNEPVRPTMADDGMRRWLPSRVAFIGAGATLFSDASCGTMVASKIARTATCPIGAALVLDGSCGVGHTFGLGAETTAVFARDASNACVPVSAADVLAFGVGAPIPASVYEPVVSADIGTPRVRRRSIGSLDEGPIAWEEIIDTNTGEPCEVVATADGTLRCLPAVAAPIAFFSDATCTAPAIAQTVTGCASDAQAPHFVRELVADAPRAFEVGRTLDVVYEQSKKGCTKAIATIPVRLFAVREISVTGFPTAVLASD